MFRKVITTAWEMKGLYRSFQLICVTLIWRRNVGSQTKVSYRIVFQYVVNIILLWLTGPRFRDWQKFYQPGDEWQLIGWVNSILSRITLEAIFLKKKTTLIIMKKPLLLLSIKNLLKNKRVSLLNILGLSIGISIFLLISIIMR